jgi:GR25 family glycosyltransferase involved in LPS biosynthesis
MKAYCITLYGHDYSEAVSERCIRTAAEIGRISVEPFPAVDKDQAERVLRAKRLRWTWTTDAVRYCPVTGLRQHPYAGSLQTRIGCAMSHLLLWEKCRDLGEPILILEHDSVFLRPMPEIEFRYCCQINDPAGATRRGQWWSEQMTARGTKGVHAKTWVTRPAERIPDGLAGNSAYLIRPHAAQELIDLVHELGVWPNDATMCAQLCPDLEEYYPFVTRVEQTVSTTRGE